MRPLAEAQGAGSRGLGRRGGAGVSVAKRPRRAALPGPSGGYSSGGGWPDWMIFSCASPAGQFYVFVYL